MPRLPFTGRRLGRANVGDRANKLIGGSELPGSALSGECFVVEVKRRVVGLAVRADGGWRFFASDPDYQELDLILYRRERNLRQAVQDFAGSKRVSEA